MEKIVVLNELSLTCFLLFLLFFKKISDEPEARGACRALNPTAARGGIREDEMA